MSEQLAFMEASKFYMKHIINLIALNTVIVKPCIVRVETQSIRNEEGCGIFG